MPAQKRYERILTCSLFADHVTTGLEEDAERLTILALSRYCKLVDGCPQDTYSSQFGVNLVCLAGAAATFCFGRFNLRYMKSLAKKQSSECLAI